MDRKKMIKNYIVSNVPLQYDGREKKLEHLYIGPIRNKESDAQYDLDLIRLRYSSADGWVEFDSFVQKIDSHYRAIRHHVQYK